MELIVLVLSVSISVPSRCELRQTFLHRAILLISCQRLTQSCDIILRAWSLNFHWRLKLILLNSCGRIRIVGRSSSRAWCPSASRRNCCGRLTCSPSTPSLLSSGSISFLLVVVVRKVVLLIIREGDARWHNLHTIAGTSCLHGCMEDWLAKAAPNIKESRTTLRRHIILFD